MQNNKFIQNKKMDRKAVVGTVLFYAILLVLLYFFGFRSMIPETEEGVLITFGTTVSGGGVKSNAPAKSTPAPKSTPVQSQSSPSASVPQKVEQEVVKTQDFDDEVPEIVAADKPKEKVKTPDPEIEKRKAEEAALKNKQKAEEDARIKKEQELALQRQRIEEEKRKKEEAEQRRKQEIQEELAKLDQEHASKSTNTTSSNNPFVNSQSNADGSGKGNTSFPGNQGAVNGDPKANSTEGAGLGKSGNSFSLEGRNLRGSLPEPKYDVQEEGTVVVEIIVDRSGKVIGANPKLRGSTTQNPDLWRVAKEAALMARFNTKPDAAEKQVGSITYHFRLD